MGAIVNVLLGTNLFYDIVYNTQPKSVTQFEPVSKQGEPVWIHF